MSRWKMRAVVLAVLALGFGSGVWYGVHIARRSLTIVSTTLTGSARAKAVHAYVCFAPTDLALARVETQIQVLQARKHGPEEDSALLDRSLQGYHAQAAVLSERLERKQQAEAHWIAVVDGCSPGHCSREPWRRMAESECKQHD